MIDLRLAVPDDIAVILRFMSELYAQDGIAFDETVARSALADLLATPAFGRVWMTVADGDVKGYLVVVFGYSLEFGGRDAFVDELFIRETERGRGHGTAALKLAENACRALGIRALHLEVGRDNLAAQQVYRRAGFYDHDRYLMTRRLDVEPS